MENEPKLTLDLNGNRFECTRENTSLFTFLGELACYDHIFLVFDEENSEIGYLFKNQEQWTDMAQFLSDNDFPMHLNLQEVAEVDQQAFEATFYADVRQSETFPQEWTNGTPTE